MWIVLNNEPSDDALKKAKALLEQLEAERYRNTASAIRGLMPNKLTDFEILNAVLYRLALSFDMEQRNG